MNNKINKSITILMLILVAILGFTIATQIQRSYALESAAENDGLIVEIKDDTEPGDNLSPYESYCSIMTITNNRSSVQQIRIKAGIERSILGIGNGDLKDKLIISIQEEGNQTLYNGSLEGLGNPIQLGSLSSGQTKKLIISMHLPEDTSNDYEEATVDINWTISTKAPESEEKYQSGKKPKSKKIEITPEPIEEVVEDIEEIEVIDEIVTDTEELDVVEEIIDIADEEIPLGIGILPQTGGIPSIIFNIFGFVVIIIGMILKKNNI